MAFALRHVGLDLTESAEKRSVDDELRVIGEHVRQPAPVACVDEVAVPSWQFVQLEPIMVVVLGLLMTFIAYGRLVLKPIL